jgi:hypothetical protein
MFRKLQEAYEQRGLIINKKKSEYMIFGNNEEEELFLDDDNMSVVDECKYLGVLFSRNGSSNEEINNRVNRGRNIITSLNSILRDKGPRKITKKTICRTVVQCCGTWSGSVGCNWGEQEQTVSSRNELPTQELQEDGIR